MCSIDPPIPDPLIVGLNQLYNRSNINLAQGRGRLRLGDRTESHSEPQPIQGSLYIGKLPLQSTYKLKEKAIPAAVDNIGYYGCIEKVHTYTVNHYYCIGYT